MSGGNENSDTLGCKPVKRGNAFVTASGIRVPGCYGPSVARRIASACRRNEQ